MAPRIPCCSVLVRLAYAIGVVCFAALVTVIGGDHCVGGGVAECGCVAGGLDVLVAAELFRSGLLHSAGCPLGCL